MRAWLKKFFIPHPENDHKPHILRWRSALCILALVAVVELVFVGRVLVFVPHSNYFASIINSVVVSETNQDRQGGNLAPFSPSTLLAEAAQMKADDMAAKGYFAHVSPEGITPWYWMQKVGYQYLYAGENLAVNFTDSKDAVDAWMNSPAHRANILDARFTEVGIGIAEGEYQGKKTVFVVQLFGTPLPKNEHLAAATGGEMQEQPKQTAGVPRRPAGILGTTTVATSAVENATSLLTTASVAIAGTEAPKVSVRDAVGEIATSPRTLVNAFFIALMGIIGIALALKIGIAWKIQHPALIINGVLLLLLIAFALSVNYSIVLSQMKLL